MAERDLDDVVARLFKDREFVELVRGLVCFRLNADYWHFEIFYWGDTLYSRAKVGYSSEAKHTFG